MSSPYAGLLAGAGATQGFEQLLARRLEAEKFQEMKRQAGVKEQMAQQEMVQRNQEFGANEAFRSKQLQSGEDLKAVQLAQAKAIADATAEDRKARTQISERQLGLARDTQSWREQNATAMQGLQRELHEARPPHPIQVVGEGGAPTWVDAATGRPLGGGRQAVSGNTAQDRQRGGRLAVADAFLTRMNELRRKINTKIGPAAGVTGMYRQGKAAMGLDPDVAEYERERKAAGRALAVAALGAQNLSDADAEAWAGMLPGARTDEETARRLTEQTGKMLDMYSAVGRPQPSHVPGGGGPVPVPVPGAPAAAPSQGGRTPVIGPNGETGSVPAGTQLPAGWRAR